MIKHTWYEWYWQQHPPNETMQRDAKSALIEFMMTKSHILQLIGRWIECQRIRLDMMHLAKKINDPNKVGQSLLLLGDLERMKGNFEQAVVYYQQCLPLFNETRNSLFTAMVLREIGHVHAEKKDLNLAMSFYQSALKLSQDLGNKHEICLITGSIGTVYAKRNELDRALSCYEEALTMGETFGDKLSISQAFGNIAVIYDLKGEYKRALEYYARQLQICHEIGNKVGLAIVTGNIGYSLWLQGDGNSALSYYQQQLNICQDLGDKYGQYYAFANMETVYSAKQNFERAADCADRCISILKELQMTRSLPEFMLCKAQSLASLEQWQEAKDVLVECFAVSAEVDIHQYEEKAKELLLKIELALS